ncbi:MAG: hypothetical protein SO016_13960 [Lachnospiraceae bacterium]|nr:hypothetical protein [Robinsoniella sp.]MDY3767772.1 hypothetical protein [Lachnospiraceae bacterium]
MDLFDKLNNLFTEAGKEVEQKAKEVSDSMRLNAKIRDEKAAIKECMEKIGRLYYEEQQGKGAGVYQESFDRIHKSQEAIRQAKKELEEYRKKEECQYCGAAMRKEDLFCSKCGMKREQPCSEEQKTPEEAEEAATEEKETSENPEQAEQTEDKASENVEMETAESMDSETAEAADEVSDSADSAEQE